MSLSPEYHSLPTAGANVGATSKNRKIELLQSQVSYYEDDQKRAEKIHAILAISLTMALVLATLQYVNAQHNETVLKDRHRASIEGAAKALKQKGWHNAAAEVMFFMPAKEEND